MLGFLNTRPYNLLGVIMDVLLEKTDSGLRLILPADPLLLRQDDTVVVVPALKSKQKFVVLFTGNRVRRFVNNLLESLATGKIVADRQLDFPLSIPIAITKQGVIVDDKFYNDFLLTLYVLERLEEMVPRERNARHLVLRKAAPKVVRGLIVPPTDVKAVRFVRNGKVEYEGYVGNDKRIKFTTRYVRDIVTGVTIIPGVLEEKDNDLFLNVFVDQKKDLLKLREPYEYIEVEEE